MGNSAHLPAISLAALLGVGALLPQAAAAQPIPSYAQRSNDIQQLDGEETITGTISKVQGEYLEINDDRGYVDRVDFTTETSMRPLGIALRPGMRVTVTGYNQGQIFDAYEIDAANAPPSYGGNTPSYDYNPQAPAPVPMTAQAPPPPPEAAPAPVYPQQQAVPVYPQQQALPPYATPVYAQPVYAPPPQPLYVPYPVPVYAYPPPYAVYPRWGVRFGFRIR